MEVGEPSKALGEKWHKFSSAGATPLGPLRVLCGELRVVQVLVHDLENVIQDGGAQIHMQGQQGAGVRQERLVGA